MKNKTPYEQLDALKDLPTNWDSYGAKPIPESVVGLGKTVISALEADGFEIKTVNPTPDECAIISATRKETQTSIEIHADGDIGCSVRQPHRVPIYLDIDCVEALLQKIREAEDETSTQSK